MRHHPHHKHIRKRIHKKFEPYPHPENFKRFLDHIIFVVGVIGPLMTLPQLHLMWYTQSAENISIATWILYTFSSLIWTLYGFIHKDKAIILTYISWLIIDLLMVAGIIYLS